MPLFPDGRSAKTKLLTSSDQFNSEFLQFIRELDWRNASKRSLWPGAFPSGNSFRDSCCFFPDRASLFHLAYYHTSRLRNPIVDILMRHSRIRQYVLRVLLDRRMRTNVILVPGELQSVLELRGNPKDSDQRESCESKITIFFVVQLELYRQWAIFRTTPRYVGKYCFLKLSG
jgi:hypothetical protein